jgi:hypothetical protein
MAIEFLNPQTTAIHSRQRGLAGRISGLTITEPVAKVINSSKDVSGIELRMLPPFIIENQTTPVFPFPGYSKLYCLTIVVSDATNQLAGLIDLKGFPRIGDREHLPINKTVYYWQQDKTSEKQPDRLHIMCSILKSKKDLRDTAAILAGLKDDKEYTSLTKTLSGLAKNAAKFNLVTDLIVEVAAVVGKKLIGVEDKPIGTIINSYTTLHGDFDQIGVNRLVYNTKDVDFEFELVVRNKKTEGLIEKSLTRGSLSLSPRTKVNLAVEEQKPIVEMQSL